MVGRIVYRQEKGRSGLAVEYLGNLTLLTGVLRVPPGKPPRAAARRLARLERQMLRAGAGRVVLPEAFPYAALLTALRPVEVLPLYRAAADTLVLAALRRAGKPPEQGRVALSGPWLCPELERCAQRLCRAVRALRIQVPGEGEAYARRLQRQWGLPVLPPDLPADVTAAFGPGGPEQGSVLRLYGPRPETGGLRLWTHRLELPRDGGEQLLALLWESGAVKREDLTAVPEPGDDGTAQARPAGR